MSNIFNNFIDSALEKAIWVYQVKYNNVHVADKNLTPFTYDFDKLSAKSLESVIAYLEKIAYMLDD